MSDTEESDKNIPYFFPDERPIRFTLEVFPHSGQCPTPMSATCLHGRVGGMSVVYLGKATEWPCPGCDEG